ncbi:hypothetical protein AMK59_3604 [Oryctes borbonicus]|uniref:Maf-like protein n=1 Tax=Oryctes borbonicus TaxID=1629725 RepID=A0A0T6B8V9_9SCAR|nr:hypothetical protein AMK59_3604 [Oryctes borbonicus]
MFGAIIYKMNNMRVVLATSSKQRAEVLERTALKFERVASNFDENLDINEYTFTEFVEKTALGKVEDVRQKLKDDFHPPDLIIGCDTMVCFENKMFGKPKNNFHAVEMIRSLTSSNKPHQVYTGIALMYQGAIVSFTEITKVYMKNLSEEEILAYVETGEPVGKAGAYAIQGLAGSFVDKVEGDYNNVIGLPLCRLTTELKKILL